MKKRLLVLLVCLFAGITAFAQNQGSNSNKPLVQFTGLIYNADSVKVIVAQVGNSNIRYNNLYTVGIVYEACKLY